jgi:O-Antigen ligase
MPRPLPRLARRLPRDLSFHVFLATVLLCLFRSRQLPQVEVALGGADLDIGPADVGLALTAVLALVRLRTLRTLPSPWLLAASFLFAALVVVSSLPNGATAVTAALKLAGLSALTLGAVAFLRTRRELAVLTGALAVFVTLAAGWALVEFVAGGGGRQGSFVGEHDLAALGTMSVAAGLACLYARPGAVPRLALVGLVAGAVAVTLGASLAGLIGVYLAAAALAALAAVRRSLRLPAVAASLAVAVAVTAGTWAIRGGEFSFLNSWFGPPPETPGQYAASWSQRLIFAYIGGRVFLDNPVLGTGWHGILPEEEFARFLPDARERFSDQPPHYFPTPETGLIPQQTYDQVLFELGLVGLGVLAATSLLALRSAIVAGKRWPRSGVFEEQAFIPLAWFASLVGVLAGAALFGGSPIAAIFWLTLGVAAAAPFLAGREAT